MYVYFEYQNRIQSYDHNSGSNKCRAAQQISPGHGVSVPLGARGVLLQRSSSTCTKEVPSVALMFVFWY